METKEIIEKLKELNISKLSATLGIPYQRMAKWVQGKANPKGDDWKKLYDFFTTNSSDDWKKNGNNSNSGSLAIESRMKKLQDENLQLYKKLEEKDKNISELIKLLAAANAEIERLKRAIEVPDVKIEGAAGLPKLKKG